MSITVGGRKVLIEDICFPSNFIEAVVVISFFREHPQQHCSDCSLTAAAKEQYNHEENHQELN